MLLQAAQTTIAHGGTHFVVLNPASAGLSAMGPGFASPLVKPADGLVIKILSVKPGKMAPMRAVDAYRALRIVRARLAS